MDHDWIINIGSTLSQIIIIIIASTISSKWCYLSILLVTGSSTEPALFHVGCRPRIHVGLHRQSQPFFMMDVTLQSQSFFILDVGLYKASPFSYWMYLHKASPFSYWMQVSIEPFLFCTGCMPLQSQLFFMLDVGLYRASPFLYWMQATTDPTLFHAGCRYLQS